MNTQAIKTAIVDWIDGVLDLPVIYANPNAPRPTTPYIIFNIISDVQIGEEESISELNPDPDPEITITYSTLNSITVSINAYYEDAYDNIKSLKKSLLKTDINASLYEDGLGLSTTGDAIRIPEEIDNQWEERAQFEVVFLYRSDDSEILEQIEHIEITNEITGDEIIIDKP